MSRTAEELGTAAYHWIFQRPDGAGFASTSHDRKQVSGSMTREPDVDLLPSELALYDQLFGSSLELEGGVGSPAFTLVDMQSGRWSGASVQLFTGSWSQEAEACLLASGALGRISMQEGRLAMSVDVLPDAARELPCIHTSPECRAVLGDQQCRVDMRSRRLRVTVMALEEDGVVVDNADLERFGMGRLHWISGPQCGLEDMIIVAEKSRLVLRDAVKSSLQIGDRAVLTEGCDGRRETCSERFANIMNFRGEPDLPGSELLLRYPGA